MCPSLLYIYIHIEKILYGQKNEFGKLPLLPSLPFYAGVGPYIDSLRIYLR